MSVSASISSQPVTAVVSGGTVSASVPTAMAVQAAVAGGVGPQGPTGPKGDAAGTLDQLDDVQLASPADGQVVRYDAQSSQWTNQPLVINGGNF